MFGVWGLGFRIWGSGFGVRGLASTFGQPGVGFGVWGLGLKDCELDVGRGVKGLKIVGQGGGWNPVVRNCGLGWGVGFRVKGWFEGFRV